MRPWAVIDRVEGADGVLELRRRGPDDLVIALDGRVLMTSRASRSEAHLGAAVVRRLPEGPRPRVIIGGLGMGITLRAALDGLPPHASVEVVELHPVVVEWCRGPLADLTAAAIADRRVRTRVGDVAERIRAAAAGGERFDGIALDLYEGVRPQRRPDADPVYGTVALARARGALACGGVFGRWCEQPDRDFERRLRAAGFDVRTEAAGDRGRRHVVCLGIARQGAAAC